LENLHTHKWEILAPIASGLSELEKLEYAVLLQADAMHKMKT